ncbi:MAG: TetR/AcrR family transcriptional regulator [Eubacteriales bacterium]|jgi:AcrR family transcriptional regulator
MTEISIKKLRMMGYFITAADEIIKEEGIEKATIRSIAEKAGYNSATIYNYFNDLEHLIFFTKIANLEVYKTRLYKEIPDDLDPLVELKEVFRIFVEETFKNPHDFYDLFFSKYSLQLNETVTLYHEIFPDRLKTENKRLKSMLSRNDIYKRNMALVANCVENGYFDESIAEKINELMILTYSGLLNKYLETDSNDVEGYTEDFMEYLDMIIEIGLKK